MSIPGNGRRAEALYSVDLLIAAGKRAAKRDTRGEHWGNAADVVALRAKKLDRCVLRPRPSLAPVPPSRISRAPPGWMSRCGASLASQSGALGQIRVPRPGGFVPLLISATTVHSYPSSPPTARFVASHVRPHLGEEIFPSSGPLAGEIYCTRYGVSLLVALLGAKRSLVNSIQRLVLRRAAGDHAPQCDMSNDSALGEKQQDGLAVRLSDRPSLLVRVIRVTACLAKKCVFFSSQKC